MDNADGVTVSVHCPSNIFPVFPFISFTAIPNIANQSQEQGSDKISFFVVQFSQMRVGSFSVEGGREETNSSLDRRDALPRFMATQTPI